LCFDQNDDPTSRQSAYQQGDVRLVGKWIKEKLEMAFKKDWNREHNEHVNPMLSFTDSPMQSDTEEGKKISPLVDKDLAGHTIIIEAELDIEETRKAIAERKQKGG